MAGLAGYGRPGRRDNVDSKGVIDMHSMNKKQKLKLIKILVAAILLAAAILLREKAAAALGSAGEYLVAAVFIASYLVIGLGTLTKAGKNILRGQVFDENFLMSIASLGAMILGDYSEGIAVMLFYQVGEWFESYAVERSRKSISSLMDIRPDYANVLRDGREETVDPYDVAVGEIILVKPGEKVPLDGVLIEGFSTLDTAALTGESVPRDAAPGSGIISGCINLTGPLKIKVTKEFGESTVSKILDLVENASSKKANVEKFITKFARYYTPIVVAIAAVMAIVPPLLLPGAAFSDWVYRALVFLVISCPCALVISVPLSFFGGVGGASKLGVLVKGSNYLEALAYTEVVVFDKTGTLTTGTFAVTEIHSKGITAADGTKVDEKRLLELAALAENYSNHPISLSIKNAYAAQIGGTDAAASAQNAAAREAGQQTGLAQAGGTDAAASNPQAPAPPALDAVREIAGHGVEAKIGALTVCAGNEKLMKRIGAAAPAADVTATVVYLAVDGVYAGWIAIADQPKPDAAEAVGKLKASGVREAVMLTGDRESIARTIAGKLGLDKVYAELLPADKVEQMEDLLAEKSPKGRLVFVGDGINDAPVLARADIGVAMGGLGSEAAIEAADIVIMTDEPSKLPKVIKISKKTLRIARQNVVFALGVKGIILVLGALGIASMWAAVFADVGVAMIAILNSIRALNIKKL